jgi:hypothetical protein
MEKFFSHEYWAQNVAKIYKILSKVVFFIVMIYGYIGVGILIIGAVQCSSYNEGITFTLFAVGIILALITPFLAGLASLTPLVTVTILERLSSTEESMRFLLIEFCESRYKRGEITKEAFDIRYKNLTNKNSKEPE